MPIIAAVDRTETQGSIVEEARELATAFDEELHVVHVISQKELREIEQRTVEETGQSVPLEEIREFAQKAATEAATDHAETYTPVGLVGEASDELVKYADTEDARFVVIGGRRRSPIGKAIFGSVAQEVLLTASCPVVMVVRENDS